MEKFWLQEKIPETPLLTPDEKSCEEHFRQTVRWNPEGRFVWQLPVKPNVKLGNSKDQAYIRLQSVERKFRRRPELQEAYSDFMNDYIERGHMSLVVPESIQLKRKRFYSSPGGYSACEHNHKAQGHFWCFGQNFCGDFSQR